MAASALLEVEGVCKSFGGVQAVRGVDLIVPEGRIHSLIGPNGAGKTTLFNLITGVYVPDAGRIRLEGQDVTGRRPAALARLGLTRTFQNLQVCAEMTAVENVMLGAHLGLDARLWAGMLRLPRLVAADRRCAAETAALLDLVGIAEFAEVPARHMPFGALKRLEVARAMAAHPRLLLLDEPAAGLNPSEKRELSGLLRELARRTTILLVEHDMTMVMSLSDHITVLANGAKIAAGDAATVRGDPDVVAAYLGPEAVAAAHG